MPIKYIPYFPEPIEGQAILDNFTRTLRYKGNYDVKEKLRRGMPYYEVEKQETVGENVDGNMVIRGECVSACAYLREKGIKVDLVYIDPPLRAGQIMPKKSISVAIRKLQKSSPRQKKNWISMSSKSLKRRCMAMSGTRKNISTGCMKTWSP